MNDEYLLAIETSTRCGSIALARGHALLATRRVEASPGIAAGLLPAVQSALSELGLRIGDVSIVAFSHGPGSFTGLRVAATVARMLQGVSACRVVAVPTLEVIARNALEMPDRPDRVAVILDAKRGQVYGAGFELQGSGSGREGEAPAEPRRTDSRDGDSGPALFDPPAVRDPAAWLATQPSPVWVMGEGVEKHRPACEAAGARIVPLEYWTPRAESVAAIGWRMAQAGAFCPPERVVPLYLRPPECEEVYEQRRAEAKARRGP